jgi:hypothetical protein
MQNLRATTLKNGNGQAVAVLVREKTEFTVDMGADFKCAVCRHRFVYGREPYARKFPPRYCPNCGREGVKA